MEKNLKERCCPEKDEVILKGTYAWVSSCLHLEDNLGLEGQI